MDISSEKLKELIKAALLELAADSGEDFQKEVTYGLDTGG